MDRGLRQKMVPAFMQFRNCIEVKTTAWKPTRKPQEQGTKSNEQPRHAGAILSGADSASKRCSPAHGGMHVISYDTTLPRYGELQTPRTCMHGAVYSRIHSKYWHALYRVFSHVRKIPSPAEGAGLGFRKQRVVVWSVEEGSPEGPSVENRVQPPKRQ